MAVQVRVKGWDVGPLRVEEDQPEGCPPMLTFDGDGILTRDEVERLRDVLTEWLER